MDTLQEVMSSALCKAVSLVALRRPRVTECMRVGAMVGYFRKIERQSEFLSPAQSIDLW